MAATSLALGAAIIAFATSGCSKKCAELDALGIPKVTKVQSCKPDSFLLETGATPEEIVRSLGAKGWVIGRQPGDYKTVRFRREGEPRELYAFEFEKHAPGGRISLDLKDIAPAGEWRTLEAIAKERPLGELRADVVKKLATLAPLATSFAKSPTQCARAEIAGVTSDAVTVFDLTYPQFDFSLPKLDAVSAKEQKELRAQWEAAIPARALFVEYTREFTEPRIDSTSRTFAPGRATADLAIVDATAKRVLCTTRVATDNSRTLTQTHTPSGEVFGNDGAPDLKLNLDRALREAAKKLVTDAK